MAQAFLLPVLPAMNSQEKGFDLPSLIKKGNIDMKDSLQKSILCFF